MSELHSYSDLLRAAHAHEIPWRDVERWRRRRLQELCAVCGDRSDLFAAFLRDRSRGDRSSRAACFAAVAAGLADLEAVFADDRPAVERDLAALRRVAPHKLARRIARSISRFRSPLLVPALIREARLWLRREPGTSLAWLAAARAAADRITVEIEHPDHFAPLRDLRIRIRAHEANVHRVAGDLTAAEGIFDEVRKRLSAGEPPAVSVAAELASFEGSLRYDQRRLPEADALLDRAAFFYRLCEDRVGLAKVAVQRGIVLRIGGDAERALQCFRQATEATDPARDAELAISPRHSLVLCLCDLGRTAEAQSLLQRTRALYRQIDLPVAPLWLLWAEGRVAAAAGEDVAAVDFLSRCADGYSRLGLVFDRALVGIDLAQVHLRLGETAEVKALAEHMAAVFAERGVDRETSRAVEIFCRAALAEAVTSELLARTRCALMLAHRPGSVVSRTDFAAPA